MALEVVEGWTGALEFQLLSDSVAQNLTGCTIAFCVRDHAGTLSIFASSTGGAETTSSTGGIVEWTPATTALLAVSGSPYTLRVRVIDALSARAYYPSGRAECLSVFSE